MKEVVLWPESDHQLAPVEDLGAPDLEVDLLLPAEKMETETVVDEVINENNIFALS